MRKLKYGPYSPSRLDTAICPYSFYEQYIKPKESKEKHENLPQARGSAAHEVFEIITNVLKENPSTVFTKEQIWQWVEESVVRHPAAMPETQLIFDMACDYIKKPPEMLSSDAETEVKIAIKWDEGKNDFVECGYDEADAFARGRADIFIVAGSATTGVIYDHKTQYNYEDADTFQMGFYAWVLSKKYTFLDTIKTVLHFPRSNPAGRHYYSEPYVWSKEELSKVEDIILTRINIVEALQQWPAIPHGKCLYCPVLVKCPRKAEVLSVDEYGNVRTNIDNFEIYDTNKAVHVAEMINVLEELLKNYKSSLNKYTKFTASGIAIHGKVFEHRSDEEIHWDRVNKSLRTDVYKLFNKYGIDVLKYMSFNQKTTQNVWHFEDSHQEFLKELSELLPRRVTSEFRGYKV